MSARYRTTCDTCGWTSKPLTSQAKADYSHRRHSCDAHRARTERAARVAARNATSGPTRDCTHLDEHGQPRHQHGERNAYVLDRCRCRPCRDAASRYERQRAKDRAYGRQSYLDAAPVRDHVNGLRAQGMGWKRIAAAAGLETSVVWKLLYGDPTRGQAPTKRVTPKTRDALLAVTLDLAPGRIIDGTGTRRRLQALVAIGWSMSEIARRLDMLPSNLGTIIHGRTEITAGTARKATVLYDELWSTPAPPSGRHGAVPARARAYARRHDWAPPLAWDDETIDNPDATPFVDAPTQPEPRARGEAYRERQSEVDPIAVQRAVDGRPPESLTRAERVEAIRALACLGLPDSEIARRLRCTSRAVLRLRSDNDIASHVETSSGFLRPRTAPQGEAA